MYLKIDVIVNKCRMVTIHDETPYQIKVAPMYVFDLLYDENYNPTSENSEEIDDKIGCYVEDDKYCHMTDEELEEYVNTMYY